MHIFTKAKIVHRRGGVRQLVVTNDSGQEACVNLDAAAVAKLVAELTAPAPADAEGAEA